MPFPMALQFIVEHMAEQRHDELDQDRAAGEGMFERHVGLEGVRIPRMLSWAELRALRQDLREAHI